jgi:hypothetical protein
MRTIYCTILSIFALTACNKTDTPPNIANQSPAATAAKINNMNDGTYCFSKKFNQDVTNIQLIISGSNITGFMNWVPYQKDSARGTLTGTKNTAGELDLLYDYMIEGSQQTETKVMKIENEKLWIKNGELTDTKNNGHLVYKDISQAKYDKSIEKADCKSLIE